MLVLTRKPAEIIRIGEDIVIKVIKTGKGTVKIGIEAPENVRVLRGELEPHTAAQSLLERLKKRQSLMVEVKGKEVEGDGHGEEEVHLVHQELVTADFS